MTSWFEQFSTFQDEQRIERLQTHCQSLESLLKECRSRKNKSSTSTSTSEDLEQQGLPLRTIKYFDWRGIAKEYPQIEEYCAREEHMVWACRAVAIGCGKELGALKTCFQSHDAQKILTTNVTAYEQQQQQQQPTPQESCYCSNLQNALGTCVTNGAHELYERRRKQRQKQQAATTS
eukprot:scaffold4911_cov100-Cylindrotheca_fusiformis.AAC.6